MTLAETIHEGNHAQCKIEDRLCDWWKGFRDIATDSYDNSLEIYFEDHVVDLEPTAEQVQRVWEWGFDRFWMNFQGGKHGGGSERYYYKEKSAAA